MTRLTLPVPPIIKRNIIRRTKKECRLIHYNGLIEILVTHGVVTFNGITYRSIADLTADFFKPRSTSSNL